MSPGEVTRARSSYSMPQPLPIASGGRGHIGVAQWSSCVGNVTTNVIVWGCV